MTGFAMSLTPNEVIAMQDKPGFMVAHQEQVYCLQTTHSPRFLGLPLHQRSFIGSTMGKGIIIGMMDTGGNISFLNSIINVERRGSKHI